MSPIPVDPETLGRGRGAPLTRPRPGHADLVGMQKYGFDEARPVLERASARETAARVALGAVARAFLAELGIRLVSHTVAIGPVRVPEGSALPMPSDVDALDADPLRCFDAETSARMVAEVDEAHKDGDTLGGVVEVLAYGLPPGLGSHVHWDRRLDAQLAAALMGIQAIKGVEVGDGFLTTTRRGSAAHDELHLADGRIVRASDRAGGTEGGMSTGTVLRVRAGMKPIATVPHALPTVDVATGEPAPRTTSGPTSARSRPRASSPRRWSRSRSPTPCSRSSGATRSPRRAATSRATSRPSPTRSRARSRRPTRSVPDAADAAPGPARSVPLPIVLVGPMGAGKSRVGARLATSVGAPFVDTDQRIVERYGPIEEIFAREGEAYFRVIEREVVAEALREEAVVSLGGGAVLDADTRDDLADLAVVWLQVSAEAVAPRLSGGTRPSSPTAASNAGPASATSGDPLYEQVAGLVIDTSRRSVARIVDEITEWAGARA